MKLTRKQFLDLRTVADNLEPTSDLMATMQDVIEIFEKEVRMYVPRDQPVLQILDTEALVEIVNNINMGKGVNLHNVAYVIKEVLA